MNRVFLSLVLGCIVATAGFAQCDPDFSFPDGFGFQLSPDPLVGETFADGYLGQDYADTIHMLIPLDATDLIGLPVPIDSIVVQGISMVGESGESLLISDVGLELTPNNNGDSPNPFTFIGSEQYCATLTGIPDTTGFFQASIDVEAWTIIFGVPFLQEVSFEGYTFSICSLGEEPGCTDESACNYVCGAILDNSSCLFLDSLGVCGGTCTADADDDGICDDVDDCVSYLQIFDFAPLYYEEDFVGSGMIETYYVQFDEAGTGVFWVNDNSFQNGIEFNFSLCLVGDLIQYQDDYGYVGVVNGDGQIVGEIPYGFTMTPVYDVVFGCTDPSSCNYLPIASQDDGSCALFDECGVCGGAGIVPGACDCEGNVTDAIGVCGGDCASDINSNGVCDSLEIPGCTYAIALNYNPLATDDDGSCELDCPQGVEGCTYELADNFDPAASIDDGTCSFELFTAPCLVYDGNGDGSVGSGDLLGLLTEFGASCN